MWRVFMWTAGTCGERRCATSEMPLAQKPPLSPAPGICLRNSSLKVPNTVEMLTPTFSNTRPFITAMVPPPPSPPPGSGRCHEVRSNRPAGRSRCRVAASSSSSRSKAAQIRSRSCSNQALAWSLWSAG